MKKILFIILSFLLFIGCNSDITVEEYELMNLSDKINIEKKTLGGFFVIAGAFSSNEEFHLYYSFFFKNKYGAIEFKRLDATNNEKNYRSKVFLKEIENGTPKVIIKEWGFNIKRKEYYLIVPKGTILSNGNYNIDLK